MNTALQSVGSYIGTRIIYAKTVNTGPMLLENRVAREAEHSLSARTQGNKESHTLPVRCPALIHPVSSQGYYIPENAIQAAELQEPMIDL